MGTAELAGRGVLDVAVVRSLSKRSDLLGLTRFGVHHTAFASPMLNEIFGWTAGVLGFYNFHYYRYYHTWRHRYTQDAERDPELEAFLRAAVEELLAE
ncbi:MAG: fatty acid desaturase [Planctomycetia bacterium]